MRDSVGNVLREGQVVVVDWLVVKEFGAPRCHIAALPSALANPNPNMPKFVTVYATIHIPYDPRFGDVMTPLTLVKCPENDDLEKGTSPQMPGANAPSEPTPKDPSPTDSLPAPDLPKSPLEI